jgi:predicted Zn-ribbon and HTH transcriptional regulator
MVKIKVQSLECQRCGYKWIPRQIDVRQCPKCKSARWDTPKAAA